MLLRQFSHYPAGNRGLSKKSLSYSSFSLTFQIGLHIDELRALELIKQKLQFLW